MKIALIGGLSRSENDLIAVAKRAGHRLECHDGRVGGRGITELRAIVERSDVVVIITRLTSHGSMYEAKRVLRLLHRDVIVLHKCGVARLQRLLDELGRVRGEGAERFSAVA